MTSVRPRSFVYATVSAGSAVLLLGLLILVQSVLGTDVLGRFSWALSWATIGEALMDFGLNQVTTRSIARDPSSATRLFRNSLALKVLPGAAMFVVLGALAWIARPDSDLRVATLLMLGSAVLRSYILTVRGVLLGLERFGEESLVVVGDRVLLLGGVAIALALGAHLVGIAVAFVVTRVIAVAAGLLVARRHVGPPIPAFETSLWMDLQRSALPLGGFLIVLTVYNYVDTILLGILATDPDRETGLYTAAYRLYEGLTYVPGIISAVLLPRLSHLWATDRAAHRRLLGRGLAASIGLAAVLGAATWWLAPVALRLVFHAEAVEATLALRILSVGLVFVFSIWLLHAVALSTFEQQLLVQTTIVGVIFNTVLNLWLIPRYGRDGAAWATVAGEALTLLLLVAGLWHVLAGRAPADATASDETEFGNLDANLTFLDESGALTPGVKVLEIGSGRGTLLRRLRDRGLDAVGVESSADRIGEARERYGNLPITQVTGTRLPFVNANFNVVVSFDVLEHIPDTGAHLDEVRRVLAPGGWYLLQTPNKWANTVFETIRWRSFTRWRADHCSLHSFGQLDRRLREHGFTATFADVPVVTPFFREKIRRYLGPVGLIALAVLQPDRWPRRWRTNLYVRAKKV